MAEPRATQVDPGPPQGPVSVASSEFAKIVLNEPLGAMMHWIAELAATVVDGAEDVSVTLIERGRPTTVAFSGRFAPRLDERQYEQGFGPCMDAAVTGSVIEIADTSTDTPYRDFSRLAAREGVRSVLSVGLSTPLQDTAGALNLYGGERLRSPEARQSATSFAAYASVALTNAALYTGAVEQVAQLEEAMLSRSAIEQAKGMIMLQRRCSADEAFGILRVTSSRTNRKLRDVAAQIVAQAQVAAPVPVPGSTR